MISEIKFFLRTSVRQLIVGKGEVAQTTSLDVHIENVTVVRNAPLNVHDAFYAFVHEREFTTCRIVVYNVYNFEFTAFLLNNGQRKKHLMAQI